MRALGPALIGLVFTAAATAATLHPATADGVASSQRSITANVATDFSAAKKRRRHAIAREYGSRYPHGPGTIACTRGGCSTVPPGCHAVEERTVDDSPSGFQIIVC